MSKSKRPLATRREFIKLGSSAVVVATLGVAATAKGAEPASHPIASVGHWGGVPGIGRRHRSPAAAYLEDGKSLLTGDPSFFSNGARIEVRGFWRPESVRARAASFSLEVIYDIGEESAPFYAWSFAKARESSPAIHSSHVKFHIPVDALGTLDLIVHRGNESQRIPFSVNYAADALKLRHGFYFIALREDDREQRIDWTRVRIREGISPGYASDGEGMLTVAGVLGESEPVPFSYLALWVAVAGR